MKSTVQENGCSSQVSTAEKAKKTKPLLPFRKLLLFLVIDLPDKSLAVFVLSCLCSTRSTTENVKSQKEIKAHAAHNLQRQRLVHQREQLLYVFTYCCCHACMSTSKNSPLSLLHPLLARTKIIARGMHNQSKVFFFLH